MAYPPNPADANTRPTYLRNIHEALYLDANNNVAIRTGFSGDIVVDTINVPGNVSATQSGTWTVNIGTIPEVEIKNDAGNAISITGNVNANVTGSTVSIAGNIAGITNSVTIVDGGSSITVDGSVNIGTLPAITGNVNATIAGGNITANLASGATVSVGSFQDGLVDAFGRLRVSNPVTLFDTQARYYDHEQFSTSTSGTANVVYSANSSSYALNVGTASGDSVLRETVRVFPYQPGKSLLVYQSFCFSALKNNLRQRVGYFDADNGVFFEAAGTTLNIVIRSSSSGTIVEDRIAQADWNTNSMSNTVGVNPCGITLNPALVQIWFCDIEWLGVGSVRVGFIVDGKYITCHTFHHANTSSTPTADNTTTYMTTANLPLRLEITNTNSTASYSMMRQICASVISEGGFNLSGSGNPRAASHVIGSPVRLPNDASFKPVIAIRLKSTMLDAVVIPINYTLVPVAQSMFQYRIYKMATTSGGSWVDSSVDSAVQYNLGPTSLVSGDIVEQSFINSTNQSSGAPTQEAFNFTYQLEREPFTNTPYEYVIMMATTGTNQDVYASIEWQEFT